MNNGISTSGGNRKNYVEENVHPGAEVNVIQSCQLKDNKALFYFFNQDVCPVHITIERCVDTEFQHYGIVASNIDLEQGGVHTHTVEGIEEGGFYNFKTTCKGTNGKIYTRDFLIRTAPREINDFHCYYNADEGNVEMRWIAPSQKYETNFCIERIVFEEQRDKGQLEEIAWGLVDCEYIDEDLPIDRNIFYRVYVVDVELGIKSFPIESLVMHIVQPTVIIEQKKEVEQEEAIAEEVEGHDKFVVNVGAFALGFIALVGLYFLVLWFMTWAPK